MLETKTKILTYDRNRELRLKLSCQKLRLNTNAIRKNPQADVTITNAKLNCEQQLVN